MYNNNNDSEWTIPRQEKGKISLDWSMAEAGDLESEKEAVVTLEEKQLPGAARVLYRARGAERPEDKSDAAIQPLLPHKHQDGRDETHRADTQAATDVADPETSVPHDLESAAVDQRGCSGSVRSLCSEGGRRECHICSEQRDTHTVLECNHTLCQRCVDGIMKRAKEPGSMLCPFCRQTTPFPQWEIRRLQEEFYSNCVNEAIPALVISPGPQPRAVNASHSSCFGELRGMGLTPRCLFITVSVLLLLGLLGCLLYLAFLAISQFFSYG